MRCPNCGAENPDIARYCGVCAKLLKDEVVLTSGRAAEASMAGPYGMTQPGEGSMPKISPLAIAALALTIALVLLAIGFALNVFYIEESVLDNYWDYGGYVRLLDFMNYSTGFGDLAAIVGLLFIVEALMRHRYRANLLTRIPQARLNSVRWMLAIAAILLAISLSTSVFLNELNVELNYRVVWRLTSYPRAIAGPIIAAALLTFAVAMRESERLNS